MNMIVRVRRNLRKSLAILTLVVIIFGGILALVPATQTIYAADCTVTSSTPTKPCSGTVPVTKADPALTCKVGSGPGCGIVDKYLSPIITGLAGIFTLVATISLVGGAMQYSSSGDDPQKVSAAKTRMYNSVLAVLAFLFLWAFLQWLVPGGVF